MNADLSGAPSIEQIEIIDLIGVGGMSRVYKARQTLIDRMVAVKVLNREAVSSDLDFQRFQQEAKLSSKLVHPNIIQILSFGMSKDNKAYIVMEYVEGKSLAEEFASEAPVTFRRFKDIFLPLLLALEHAHKLGVLHRDIKPSNIICGKTESGELEIKLLDFGIAKALCDPTVGPGLTRTGAVVGSPSYMSPEQCQGKELDLRSDLYSLSCVMFEALNQQPPFKSDSTYDVMYRHMHETRPSTRELSVQMEIPEKLAKIIVWGLNKEPARRPESATRLYEKLSSALDEITLDRTPSKSSGRKGGTGLLFPVACFLTTLLVLGNIAFFAFKTVPTEGRKTVKAFEVSKQKELENDSGLKDLALGEQLSLHENQLEAALIKLKQAEQKLEKKGLHKKRLSALMRSSRTACAVAKSSSPDKQTLLAQQALAIAEETMKVASQMGDADTYLWVAIDRIEDLQLLHRNDEALALTKNMFVDARKIAEVTPRTLAVTGKKQIMMLIEAKKFAEAERLLKAHLAIIEPIAPPDGSDYSLKCLHAVLMSKKNEDFVAASSEVLALAEKLERDNGIMDFMRAMIFQDFMPVMHQAPKPTIHKMQQTIFNELRTHAAYYDTPQGIESASKLYIDIAFLSLFAKEKLRAKDDFSFALEFCKKSPTEQGKSSQREILSRLIELNQDAPEKQRFYQETLKELSVRPN